MIIGSSLRSSDKTYIIDFDRCCLAARRNSLRHISMCDSRDNDLFHGQSFTTARDRLSLKLAKIVTT